MFHLHLFPHNGPMQRKRWSLLLADACACWNWKCALLSAAMRSLVYLVAMARSGSHSRLGLVAVEMAYVTLTAGIYAGMQQRALGLRSRRLGNLVIAVGIPGLAQLLDWLTHRTVGPAAPSKAIFAVCLYTLISALFHRHVMRRGAFLTGHAGRTLGDDFRRMPRLIFGFVLRPIALLSNLSGRLERPAQSESAL
jgi:hypothetical protein